MFWICFYWAFDGISVEGPLLAFAKKCRITEKIKIHFVLMARSESSAFHVSPASLGLAIRQ